jgi:hypothetical protein
MISYKKLMFIPCIMLLLAGKTYSMSPALLTRVDLFLQNLAQLDKTTQQYIVDLSLFSSSKHLAQWVLLGNAKKSIDHEVIAKTETEESTQYGASSILHPKDSPSISFSEYRGDSGDWDGNDNFFGATGGYTNHEIKLDDYLGSTDESAVIRDTTGIGAHNGAWAHNHELSLTYPLFATTPQNSEIRCKSSEIVHVCKRNTFYQIEQEASHKNMRILKLYSLKPDILPLLKNLNAPSVALLGLVRSYTQQTAKRRQKGKFPLQRNSYALTIYKALPNAIKSVLTDYIELPLYDRIAEKVCSLLY